MSWSIYEKLFYFLDFKAKCTTICIVKYLTIPVYLLTSFPSFQNLYLSFNFKRALILRLFANLGALHTSKQMYNSKSKLESLFSWYYIFLRHKYLYTCSRKRKEKRLQFFTTRINAKTIITYMVHKEIFILGGHNYSKFSILA